MPDNHPPPSVRNRVEEGTEARGYRHHLAIPGGDGGGRPVLSRDGDLSNCPHPRGAQCDGRLILPFGTREEVFIFRDGDGNFFTEDPLLRGPYTRVEDVIRAASQLFRDRTQPWMVSQYGRPSRPRGARPSSSMVLTRYGPGNRTCRTRRAPPSPVLTEDLPPPPLPSDKLVAAAAESVSALTLQEPYVSSSVEVHDTTSPEELVASTAQMVPHNTTDGTQLLGHCYSASSGPTIWYRSPPDWYFMFFIRMDHKGSFHMYPDLGGPFQSLKEADVTIGHHLDKLQREAKCNEQDDISFVERLIRRCVFYPDGTPKSGPNSLERKHPKFNQRHFVQAILDQYNDDHNLLADLAHELFGDVIFQCDSEGTRRYYHFNFTTKVKEDGGACNLFFAEVIQMERDGDWVISCCCTIKPNYDYGHCYGCSRDETPDIRHPKNTDAYTCGHADVYMGFGGDPFSDSDDDEETQMAKLRKKFKGRDRIFSKDPTKCLNEATVVKN